jgi:hypothetical protein
MAIVTLTENFTTADGPFNGYNGWTSNTNLVIQSNELVNNVSTQGTGYKTATPIVNLPISFSYRIVESAEGASGTNARPLWRISVGGSNALTDDGSGYYVTLFQVGDTSNGIIQFKRNNTILINQTTGVSFLDTDTSGFINCTFNLNADGTWTSTGNQPGSGISYSIGGTITPPAHVTGGNYRINSEAMGIAPFRQAMDNLVITHNDSLAPITTNNSLAFAGGI